MIEYNFGTVALLTGPMNEWIEKPWNQVVINQLRKQPDTVIVYREIFQTKYCFLFHY